MEHSMGRATSAPRMRMRRSLTKQQNGSSFMRFLHFLVVGERGMWLVLACGLISVWQATNVATPPAPMGRDAVTAFSRGTLMSIPAATGLSLAHMGTKVPNIPELANNPRFDLVVIEGLAEALSPSILGFS